MRRAWSALAAALLCMAATGSAVAATDEPELPHVNWPQQGVFGTFDRAALQRGLQVYQEVCSACHSLNYIAFRNLTALGFSADDVKAIATQYQVEDGPNDEGDMYLRTARPSDYFPPPFANEKAARAANGGALPPDLSLIIKAREGGPDYVHGILTGYEEEPPEGFDLAEGKYYNRYFPGHQIAMPPPLYDDAVEYADGTPATLDQMARDIASFLSWAAEPELEERKETGLKVLIFIAIFTALLYVIFRRIAARVH